MTKGVSTKKTVTSGVTDLDDHLGGLQIGDNVIWYDKAGSLAWVFCRNFLRSSQADGKPILYVTFDRSPKALLERLGPLAENPLLNVLDCFTWGKGAGSDFFKSFYNEPTEELNCRIIKVTDPRRVESVIDVLYEVHSPLKGDVRFIFESLTGMEELWGGEEAVVNFYRHSCPRLYELNTIAYWIIETDAHSERLKAQINQIAQVVIDLTIRRGKTSLVLVKADGRELYNLGEPSSYSTKDDRVSFQEEKRSSASIPIGRRLKEARARRGISQTELAKLVGVTPSTISQIEGALIYPSLPALLKMAEVLRMEPGSFFHSVADPDRRLTFPLSEAMRVELRRPAKGVTAKILAPADSDWPAESHLVEIAPGKSVSSHFFAHKGPEMGYLICGALEMIVDREIHKLEPGDVVHLSAEIPDGWRNPGTVTAKMLWIKLR